MRKFEFGIFHRNVAEAAKRREAEHLITIQNFNFFIVASADHAIRPLSTGRSRGDDFRQ